MLASEYVAKATVYIADPVRALAVRRELQEHLREATDELVGKGIDPETAELVAVARMGSPESLAMDLAEAHHRHLPWRYYLAIVPALVLLGTAFVGTRFYREIAPFWYVVLAATLMPSWEKLVRAGSQVWLDAVAKRHWLRQQPWRAPLVAGGITGGITGLQFALGVVLSSKVAGPSFLFLILLMPLGVSLGGLLLFRSQASPLPTAGVASVVFSLICFAAMFGLKNLGALAAALSISGGYTFLMFSTAWVVIRLEASGRLSRVRT